MDWTWLKNTARAERYRLPCHLKSFDVSGGRAQLRDNGAIDNLHINNCSHIKLLLGANIFARLEVAICGASFGGGRCMCDCPSLAFKKNLVRVLG